jgi:hypothetical protein
MSRTRRKIRLIEGNAKCRHPLRDFAAGVYLSEVQKQYTYSHWEGGRVEPGEKGIGATVQSWGRKYQHE